MTRLLVVLSLVLAIVACAAPGTEVAPAAGDFAFLEVQLQG